MGVIYALNNLHLLIPKTIYVSLPILSSSRRNGMWNEWENYIYAILRVWNQ